MSENNEVAVAGTFGNDSDSKGRDRWPSRTAFYLAAVGSAVGFGNVWRFPALAKDYGGGAFFVPYFMALFIIGLPVLILEIALGQYHQTGNVGIYGSMHARFRGVGVASCACAFMLVVYYSILLAWVTNAFFDSFGSGDPWKGGNGTEAVGYFFNDIIGMDTLEGDLRPTRVVGANAGYNVLVWFSVWLCLAFGLMSTGRIVYFTMGLPILLLFIFVGKSASLPGSSAGIQEYIGKWDMSVLSSQADVWSTAVSQIFFSLSITFGTMPAYGSHCPRGEPAYLNSIVIGLSNSMFSFLSGFAVFAAMGHLAFLQGIDVNDVPYAGFSLVFGTWPVVFGTFKGGEHWVRLLFFNLFLLGIDSAFSILESPLSVIMDTFTKKGTKVAKWKVTGILCTFAYLLSIMYATDAGLIFLDTIDFYINFVLLLIGFFETFGAGWMYGIESQIEKLGPKPVFAYMITEFGSVLVACGIWFGLGNDNEVWAGFVALFACYSVGMMVTLFFLKQKMAEDSSWTWSTILDELCLKNVMDLRLELQEVVGYMPWLWAFCMKHLIPQILLILFLNLATSNNSDGKPVFGNYSGYENWPYQVLGILTVVLVAVIIIAGALVPDIFVAADLTVGYDDQPEEKKLDEVESSEPEEEVLKEEEPVQQHA